MSEPQYIIFDTRNGDYYLAPGKGYTLVKEEAYRYSYKEIEGVLQMKPSFLPKGVRLIQEYSNDTVVEDKSTSVLIVMKVDGTVEEPEKVFFKVDDAEDYANQLNDQEGGSYIYYRVQKWSVS